MTVGRSLAKAPHGFGAGRLNNHNLCRQAGPAEPQICGSSSIMKFSATYSPGGFRFGRDWQRRHQRPLRSLQFTHRDRQGFKKPAQPPGRARFRRCGCLSFSADCRNIRQRVTDARTFIGHRTNACGWPQRNPYSCPAGAYFCGVSKIYRACSIKGDRQNRRQIARRSRTSL